MLFDFMILRVFLFFEVNFKNYIFLNLGVLSCVQVQKNHLLCVSKLVFTDWVKNGRKIKSLRLLSCSLKTSLHKLYSLSVSRKICDCIDNKILYFWAKHFNELFFICFDTYSQIRYFKYSLVLDNNSKKMLVKELIKANMNDKIWQI